MESRLLNRIRFLLERWLQGGAGNQLLFVAGIILAISFIGGLLAWALTDVFGNPLDAVWWSFLRLSDPGYLGDDEGIVLRLISTIVTVLGYVLFLGSLIAIMTQWLNQTMRRLESGLTPITIGKHILILGWTNRTPHLIRELVDGQTAASNGRQQKPARIVILAEDVGPELRHELRETLGEDYNRWRIILRSGSPLKIEHLKRVDFEHASIIILPGSDFVQGGHEMSDARAIKSLMTIAQYLPLDSGDEAPDLMVEILDSGKATIAQRAYPGRVEVVSSDSFISRLIAQNVRHRGLSLVYSELLSYARGNEFYVHNFPSLTGVPFADLQRHVPEAIVLGVVRFAGGAPQTILNPPPDLAMQEEDLIVGIAWSLDRFAAADSAGIDDGPEEIDLPPRTRTPPAVDRRRILLVGWNHRVPSLLREFSSYEREHFQVDLLASVSEAEREDHLADASSSETLRLRHIVGDITDEQVLDRLQLHSYDSIVLLGQDRLGSGDESDARTILSSAILRSVLPDSDAGPHMIIELMDPANALLVRQRSREVITSPVVLSHLLAHISLRPELGGVFTELFGPGGSEIFFRPAGDYGMSGRDLRFRHVQHEAGRHGEIALGIQTGASETSDGAIHLNPARERTWHLTDRDRIIVLATY